MLRKVITAAGPLCLGATAITISDASKNTAGQSKDEHANFKCKPTDLPIYTPLHAKNKPRDPPPHPSESMLRKNIHSGVTVVRTEVFGAFNAVASQKKIFDDAIDKGKEQTKFIVEYLNEPTHTIPRVGAITIGGLAGFIFALRGGFIRRVLFTGLGAGGIASICYPKEAEIYAQHGIVEVKKCANIAYNFALGVKPGDDVNSPSWPKIPTNLSEISDSISDIAKSAKDALFSSKK